MGLLNALTGNASEIDAEKIAEEFRPMLASDERIEKVFQLVRDLYVFTNRRIVVVDRQGMTGRKTQYMTIPYRSIERFAKESAGLMDLDAELKLWVRGIAEPLVWEFRKNNNVNEAYRLLSEYAL